MDAGAWIQLATLVIVVLGGVLAINTRLERIATRVEGLGHLLDREVNRMDTDIAGIRELVDRRRYGGTN